MSIRAVSSLCGAAGMRAQRPAWQAAFASELVSLRQEDLIQVLLDVVKTFETILHSKLMEAATAKNYSVIILT